MRCKRSPGRRSPITGWVSHTRPCARRGVGRSIMDACEREIVRAGFRDVVIMATLAGEPLYASLGYGASERCAFEMPGGLRLPVVRMEKSLSGPVQPH